MRLEATGNETIMHYRGNAQFGGRIASVAQRVVDQAVQAMIRESFDALDRYLLTESKYKGNTKPLG